MLLKARGLSLYAGRESNTELRPMISLATILLGAFVVGGGVMGYVKAGSMPSLIMGAIFGSSLIASGLAMSRGVSGWPLTLAVLTASFLTLFFGYRLFSTGKLMPALPMIVLCGLWLLLYGRA